jgi:hypothetical protein
MLVFVGGLDKSDVVIHSNRIKETGSLEVRQMN